MPWFDLPLAELRGHRTGTEEPPGLTGWWEQRLSEARAAARPPEVTGYQPGIYALAGTCDVEFSGARGDRIRGWYLRPADAGGGPGPVVVTFIGYGGGRGLPTQHILLPALGYAVFVMDTRGQGGRWRTGATGDPAAHSPGPENSTVMTRGITRPGDYYYTRLFTDAARAVETAAELDGADPARIAVSGGSQGARWRSPPRRCSARRPRSATPTSRSSATSSGRSPWHLAPRTRRGRSSSPRTWT